MCKDPTHCQRQNGKILYLKAHGIYSEVVFDTRTQSLYLFTRCFKNLILPMNNQFQSKKM